MSRARLKLVEKKETRACACDEGLGRVEYKDGVGSCSHCGLTHREILQAECQLVKGRESYSWVIICCPYCGQSHQHGGGPLSDDPKNHLGFRVSHCMPPFKVFGRQYELVEARG